MTIVSSRMNSRAPVSLVTTTATNESSPEPPNSSPDAPPRRLSPHASVLVSSPQDHAARSAAVRRHRRIRPPGPSRDREGALPDRSSNIFLTMLRYSELPCSMLTLSRSRASFRLFRVRASCSWVVRLDFS